MTREEMIKQIVEIYDSMPKNASSYHIVDMILYAAEKRGMHPPMFYNSKSGKVDYYDADGNFCWEGEEDEEGL